MTATPTAAAARAPGRPRDAEATRAILDAALRQVEDCGYAAVTLEGVAAAAGVSRATIYRRFRDKADLVTAAIVELRPLEPPPDPTADPRAELLRFLEAYDARMGESALEVIGGLLGQRQDACAMARLRQRVVGPRMAQARGLLEAAVARGELDPAADLDLALAMLSGAVLARRVMGIPAGGDWAETAVAAIWRGLAPGRRRRGRPARRP